MKARIEFSFISIHRKLENYLAPFFFLPFSFCGCCLKLDLGLGWTYESRDSSQGKRQTWAKGQTLNRGTDLGVRGGISGEKDRPAVVKLGYGCLQPDQYTYGSRSPVDSVWCIVWDIRYLSDHYQLVPNQCQEHSRIVG